MRMNLGGYKWIPVDGYGRYCIKTTQALLRAGHDVYPFEIDALDRPAWYQQAQGLSFDKATIQLMPPNMMRTVPGRCFSYTMHESKRLPMGWADSINNKSQWLLVPSPWLVEVFEDAGVEVPIEVVKSGIDPEECQIVNPNRHRPFTFGCLADRAGRKGHDEVYTAFYEAFDHRDRDVRLIMKCRPGSLPNLDFSYSTDDRLTVWRADVENVSDIFSQFDAFIFPTKCEGWGQPCREAAACGVPTVVTRWSGTDDETDRWAIPLDNFTMVESGMESCGGEWAQPSIDEIIHWMRWIYEHQDEARTRALQGALWLRENRTYAHAANNLVTVMSERLGAPRPERMALTEVSLRETAKPIVTERSNGHAKEPIAL